MADSVYNFLKDIKCLRKVHQVYWRYRTIVLRYWKNIIPVLVLECRYNKRRRELKHAIFVGSEKKIRVLFPISAPSKWKVQALYDMMKASNVFSPCAAVTPMDIEFRMGRVERLQQMQKLRRFLTENNITYVDAYDDSNDECLSFREFSPDIVFYTQPWSIAKVQMPKSVSRYALTCYIQYYVENYGFMDIACVEPFHRMVWRYFALNDLWAKAYTNHIGHPRAVEVIGTGHCALDLYNNIKGSECDKVGWDGQYVIYAPHFSCGCGEYISTFLEYGENILELARSHDEIRWCFKPHPSLKFALERYCGWSMERIVDYYSEWEKLGDVCYDGNYQGLFDKSTAMITDCGSFLLEYACTGKPIIHLISKKAIAAPHPVSAMLFDTYYSVRSWGDLEVFFEKVVVGGDDFKKGLRLDAVQRMKLLGNNASANIMAYLTNEILGERN